MENATERHKVVLGTWEVSGAKGPSASRDLAVLPGLQSCLRMTASTLGSV